MGIKYICYFQVGEVEVKTNIPEIPTTTAAYSGFWVDEDFQHTRNHSKCRYWIPAARVLYVEKVVDDGP